RLPGSSANPMLEQLTGHRLKLKVLNKQDLADATQTEAWLAWYNAQPNTRAIALDAGETAPAQRLIKACRELAPHRGGMAKPLRVMICGIPNVGKSTLMNTLVGRKAAKTGDEAGVTRVEQRINLASDFYLFDTPGMLWPKITVDQSGYHLAASGAVGRNAYEDEDVALELLKSLREPYAAQLAARFKLDDVAAIPTTDEEVLLSEVGRKRGAVMGGGRINIAKAAEIVLHDFRAGLIGRITLETPEQFAQWWAEGQAKEAEREAAKLARKQKKHGSRKPADADADVDDDEEEDESDEG
ncbi:MAG TPA: ribosome biogenesis GTPase YlqF, partial [Aquabacterium sp.]|nr:ribosome biogenesis GTPase YlqF [Aquabacterium sp.]